VLTTKYLKTLTLVALTACIWSVPAFSSQWGLFKGDIVTQWLKDGRRMLLKEDFSFIDSAGVTWLVPKGAVVDGASIPKPFWSIIGGPLEGKYRDASVIHDYYCEAWKKHGRSSKSVHKAFYHAMLASDVPEAKAITMYIAVRKFGPKWNQPGEVIGGSAGGWSGQLQQYYEPSKDVSSSDVDRIERIGIELAQKGTPPSAEVIDSRIYSSDTTPGLNLPSQDSPPPIPRAH